MRRDSTDQGADRKNSGGRATMEKDSPVREELKRGKSESRVGERTKREGQVVTDIAGVEEGLEGRTSDTI